MAMDKYKSYYLQDLLPIIDKAALDCMMSPVMDGKKADGTQMNLSELASRNSMTAWHNDGVRELRQMLIEDLTTEVDEDG